MAPRRVLHDTGAVSKPPTTTQPATRIVLRTALYYVVVLGAGYLLWRALPGGGPLAPASLRAISGRDAGSRGDASGAVGTELGALDDVSLAMAVGVAMISAVLLAIPVAWIYGLTRQKRGYQQSVVQLLIMLPAVVSGVVGLVKYSVALAFALAGIVAAVRFRNSLDDSKDAVYVFLATALGLAAGVNLPVAAVFSLSFNAIVLLLWYTDFGSAPVELDGRIAERRMQRARNLSRTGTFVARMDEEVFRNMTREQLQGVAERAWKRAAAVTGEEPAAVVVDDARLRIHARDASGVRRLVEPRLHEFTKQWRFGSATPSPIDGEVVVMEYIVQLKKKVTPDEFVSVVRTAGGGGIIDVDLR